MYVREKILYVHENKKRKWSLYDLKNGILPKKKSDKQKKKSY